MQKFGEGDERVLMLTGWLGRASRQGAPSLLLPSVRGTWDQPKVADFCSLIEPLGRAKNLLLGQIRLL